MSLARSRPSTGSRKQETLVRKTGSVITPEAVLKLTKESPKFLCPASANNVIQFLEFRIRDPKSNEVFFEVKRTTDLSWDPSYLEVDDSARSIHYTFSKSILTYPSVGTTLVFAVGAKELKSFRMIERHYFKDRLLKSFDFDFGFCIPNSINTWESVYNVPKLDSKTINDIVANPGKTASDSFYFVDDKLIMHTKAYYTYV
ncbi:GMP-PDE, delta subunit-domain-containing protein [Zopfochytrium polystomum]|nr:GMP-PDE, delta subunit-domain-containing protein [Zopfochytrium polystomum]